jgi:UDP-N-acetylmuramoylalanine--D-glutamate ligase
MIAVECFKGKTVGIFGLARSGLSAARALKQGGARVIAWDDKEASRLAAAKDGVTLEVIERWPWQEVVAVILSPGVPLTHPEPHPIVRRAKSVGAEVIGDIELFARAIRPQRGMKGAAPVIAITGTNGKSTTTALIGHILQSCGYDAQVGGNIGKPALDLAEPKAKTVYVLEVSSYQVDLAPGLVPDVALLTNLSPDHIDRHGTMENYAAVKETLLAHTAADGHVAVGVDDPHSSAVYTRLAAARGANAVAISVGNLKTAARLRGAHIWQNAALAYAAVRRLVRDPRAIVSAIARFPGLAHRIEDVGRIGKVRFINDSKATNADAAARACLLQRHLLDRRRQA